MLFVEAGSARGYLRMGRNISTFARLRRDWIWAAVAASGLLVFSLWVLSKPLSSMPSDYPREAAPAFDALVSGHIRHFVGLAPVYGGSLLMRAPFVLVARAFGAGEDGMFRASVIPALLACGALAVWLSLRMRRGNVHWLAPLAVIGVCVLNPIARQAVIDGHPEDLLAAVLCVAAVLCAIHDRPIWAGVLVGLAIANKQWAVLAVGPVLVALPRKKVLALMWAAAVAVVMTTPFAIAAATNPGQGLPVNTGSIFTQWQAWWFFGTVDPGARWGRAAPVWTAGLAHPLIVGISIPLTLLYVYQLRRRRASAADALLLLAFLILLRCALDPWDVSYYSFPFLIALVTWEALRYRRFPVFGVTASLIVWFLYTKLPDPSLHLSTDTQALVFLVVSLSAATAMAYRLYTPGLRERVVRRLRTPATVESPLEPG
jgi:hypothetical protein